MRRLVIEDYRPLQQSLTKGLREAGFAVDTTRDGEEGLWYAMGNEYDVIVLDLMLPGIGGLEILRTMRRKGRNSHVLILTAIVVALSTTGVALAFLISIHRKYHTLDEKAIIEEMRR